MSDLAAPDPAQMQRGSVALAHAPRISTLLPAEHEAIFSILRSLNTADELLPRPLSTVRSRLRRVPDPTLLGYALNVLAGAALRYRERLGLVDPPWR